MNFSIIISIIFLPFSLLAQERYFVSFLAQEGVPGHAFISIGRESPKENSSISDGTWGMYPAQADIKDLIIGEVPGNLRDDYLRQKDHSFVSEVDKKEYKEIKKIISDWRNRGYQMKKSDCLTFVIEVANAISDKIKIPKRQGYQNLPARYLEKLIEINK